jgi:hypothetical protein
MGSRRRHPQGEEDAVLARPRRHRRVLLGEDILRKGWGREKHEAAHACEDAFEAEGARRAGKHLGLYGRGARTIANAACGAKRDANAILRERLLKIAA